ncbi:MAG: bifunctional 5,10-methylenetetrahydrofolate dehydrogenase/5,10-methenyltetrahydrofolate cyclohydrolase [bacterium]|nr:bifunctional 5,10-methylenetetrahydrofolate dehydrogenase/5,10-methenyltetrahydrofolate cyclohydrolase [bacterium]
MSKIINGKLLAEKIKDGLVYEITKLPTRPNLAILLVGDRADSQLYVTLKEREAKKIGIDTHLYKFDDDTSEAELLKCVDFINKDDLIDGVLLQLPLPKQFNTDKVVNAIKAEKDVDGFHADNLKKIKQGKPFIMPPLAGVILEMLQSINQNIQDKKIALLAHSDIFMQGVGNILEQKGAKMLNCAYGNKQAAELMRCARQADIIITAVGKKHYLSVDYVKPGAVVIDIGIIKEGKETYGDVDFDGVSEVAGFITPVPGGVGPMTIACAFRNVVEIYKKKHATK